MSRPTSPRTQWSSSTGGWEAVASADRVIKAPIYWRAAAEQCGYEVLDAVPSWLDNTDEYDLVTVDRESIPEDKRRSS